LVNEDGLLANNHFSSNRGLRVFLCWLARVGKASFAGEYDRGNQIVVREWL